MRTSFRSITSTAVLAAVVTIGAVGCSSSKSAKTADTSPTTAAASATTAGSATTKAGSGTDAVTIKNFSYNPSAVTVKEGTKVTWTNSDGFAHTVTDRTGPATFNSGHIKGGSSFSVTFTKPGTYQYFCGIHNYMSGSITVTK